MSKREIEDEVHKAIAAIPGRLKEARGDLEMTQAQASRKSGIKPEAISHYETGRRTPKLPSLVKLAEVYQVSIDWILGRKESKT